jgi:hypothetical protein
MATEMETFKQGDRVEYRNQQDQSRQGRIERVQGSGQSAHYTIRDEQTAQQEDVQHSRIARRL